MFSVNHDGLDKHQITFPSKTEAEDTTSQGAKGKPAWPRMTLSHIKGTTGDSVYLLCHMALPRLRAAV